MEDFKEKLPIIIAVIIVIALIVGAYYFLVVHKDQYYTQIDNTKIEEVSGSDDMKYEYTLTAYNKNGKEKESIFCGWMDMYVKSRKDTDGQKRR